MKKLTIILTVILTVLIGSSFTLNETIVVDNSDVFNIDTIPTHTKKYETIDFEMCGDGSVKTYMDYRLITSPSSKQYRYIQEHMNVDLETGFLYDEDGFIGAALGSHFGEIGSKYYFTLENGVVLPIVKIESKADQDTDESNCFNPHDTSVIEFVIDTDIANNYFGQFGNNLVLSGNYGNYSAFKGNIVKVEKVLETKIDENLKYDNYKEEANDLNIFYYGSGY